MDNWAQAFIERITDLRRQSVEHLTSGRVETFDEYRYLCGVLNGFDIAERELKQLLSEVGEE